MIAAPLPDLRGTFKRAPCRSHRRGRRSGGSQSHYREVKGHRKPQRVRRKPICTQATDQRPFGGAAWIETAATREAPPGLRMAAALSLQ